MLFQRQFRNILDDLLEKHLFTIKHVLTYFLLFSALKQELEELDRAINSRKINEVMSKDAAFTSVGEASEQPSKTLKNNLNCHFEGFLDIR